MRRGERERRNDEAAPDEVSVSQTLVHLVNLGTEAFVDQVWVSLVAGLIAPDADSTSSVVFQWNSTVTLEDSECDRSEVSCLRSDLASLCSWLICMST